MTVMAGMGDGVDAVGEDLRIAVIGDGGDGWYGWQWINGRRCSGWLCPCLQLRRQTQTGKHLSRLCATKSLCRS